MIKSAVISDCGLFRYALGRQWDAGLLNLNYIMLNPSKADATEDDPTIRKCIGFAKRLGYGGFVVTNLFAYRATNPKDLSKHGFASSVGPANDRYILEAATACGDVVAAWGANLVQGRDDSVKKLLEAHGVSLKALAFTQAGHPRHPLMLGYEGVSLKPVRVA